MKLKITSTTSCTSWNCKKAMTQHTTSILLIFLMTIINETSAATVCNSSSENWQSRIGILISPIITDTKIREIEIYWNNLNIESEDRISLWEKNSTGVVRELYTVKPNVSSGVQKTGVEAEFVPSSNLSFVQRCTKYEVSWTGDKGTKMKECLKLNPTWMKDRKDILGPLKIRDIFLPGTHDSASYDDIGDKIDFVSAFAITQDLDILGQLIHGVRYLDIRVGFYPETNETWWTNHGQFYRSVPLETVIDQVKEFLNNTEEIVIMDIREFPVGFNNFSDHEALVEYLEDEFENYYLKNDRGWGITLNDVWSSRKRLIIGYENARIVNTYNSMWPCVTHNWGNVKSVESLYQYLHRIETAKRSNIWKPRSAMAELTANFVDIITNRLGNLRDMAHQVNLNVSNWYSTVFQFTANIVAVDFVRSTDIVEIAIKSNENRYLHCWRSNSFSLDTTDLLLGL